ncbi:Tol-Pal system beta propeller repeat protein TolB [Candidatus Entotheonella palauensis]|nr:Tol-Pal system beta propeller repeat protein TolB [Candidatus Entotheonella palauensis]
MALLMALAAAQTRVYIDVDQAGGDRLPLALPQWLGEEAAPQLASRVQAVLRQDLVHSGLFRVLDPATYIDARPQGLDTLRYQDWAAIGAVGVIAGQLGLSSDTSQVVIELVLHDVLQHQSRLVGKEYRASRNRYREVAHRFSDVVFQAFTGEPGPFNTQVICVRPRSDRGKDIIQMDYDGHGVAVLVQDGALNLQPSLSPDGRFLAYTSYRDGFPNIYIREMETGKEQRITSGPGLALPGGWSPNGQSLLLSQTGDGNSDIFLYHTRRRSMKRLTTYWGIDVSPSFAPDGQRFVFTSDRSGAPQLYISDRRGGKPLRLTYGGSYNTSPIWSPKADLIAFVGRSETDSLDIYTIGANGQGLRRLTDADGSYEAPSWSPNGRFLMYVGQRGDTWLRYLMRQDGQGKQLLTSDAAACLAPQWIVRTSP